MITFEEYLTGKKIDSAAFQQNETARWEAYKLIFEQVHPESFTTQKKFIINDLRRQYQLRTIPVAATTEEKKTAKPVIRPAVSKPSTSLETKIVSPETEKPSPIENTDSATEEPVKKVAKPMMRPMIKKVEETAEPTESMEISSEELPKKPAHPVMKPVMKKPVMETPEDQSIIPANEDKIVSAEEPKPTETPASKPVLKKPVMRPVMKKPDWKKSSE